ncbi:MAG: hypothetical protein H6738_07735 [Alphaproteobacteria bacterium]|nr:hypothetical protein [Alphaproteobacteria bacterium]
MIERIDAGLVAVVLAAPLVAVHALVLPFLLELPLSERAVGRAARVATSVHLLTALVLLASAAALGPATADLGRWYGDAEVALELSFAVDLASAGAVVVVALVGLVVLRFAERYLHGDPGHLRFFATSLLALTCLDAIALAGSLDLLFAGWELLGLCSFVLMAYFHERQATVDRALRTILSYRAGDLGLLLALVLLHAAGLHPTLGPGGEALPAGLAAATGLLLLPTAAGKAGLVPFSAWLARSAEGPTPSTAMFYAGLSVHAGPWLLLRAWPLYADAPIARAGLVALGLLSAASLSAHAATRSDVKGAVVVAGGAQIGLVIAEIGLGWHTLATVHLLGNLALRVAQVLRAPDVLRQVARREALTGRPRALPRPMPALPWLWSSEGWFEAGPRLVVGLLLRIAGALDAGSRMVESWAVGGRDREDR